MIIFATHFKQTAKIHDMFIHNIRANRAHYVNPVDLDMPF